MTRRLPVLTTVLVLTLATDARERRARAIRLRRFRLRLPGFVTPARIQLDDRRGSRARLASQPHLVSQLQRHRVAAETVAIAGFQGLEARVAGNGRAEQVLTGE